MTTLSDVVPATNSAVKALAANFNAATSAPVTATINDAAAHVLGPFTPQLARDIWLTLNATAAATGVAQLLRSNDGGATKIGVTAQGAIKASYQFNAAIGAIVNEAIHTESDATAKFYLSIQLSAGTVTVRLAQ
jgi:leucyl-tRNA synthetase